MRPVFPRFSTAPLAAPLVASLSLGLAISGSAAPGTSAPGTSAPGTSAPNTSTPPASTSNSAASKEAAPKTVAPKTAPNGAAGGVVRIRPANAAFAGEFPLESGDVLAVTVANHPEMSGTLPITAAGKVSLPILGNLTIAGKTLAQAERQITAAFNTQLNNPQVTVLLVRSRPRQVLLIGALRGPGALDLRPNLRITEAIDSAGGLAGEPGDLVVTLVRGKALPQPIDLPKIVAFPEDPANLTLKVGDILRFNLLPGRAVAVTGDVKNPSNLVMRRATRLRDALDAAGGLIQKPETSRVTLVRGGKEIPVDAAAAFNERGGEADVKLLNGDLISVEAIRTKVSIVAFQDQVKNSGPVSLEGQAHLLQAVLAANLSVEPSQVRVAIQRGNEKIPVDIERAAYDPKADVPLRNDDLLVFTRPPGPTVRVTGEVGKQDTFNLKENATLLDALVAAGNLTTKPDQVKINILRVTDNRQSILNVDPVSLIARLDVAQNVRLKEGDLVVVNPVQTNTVFISGEVTRPETYVLGENDGVVELLLRAGGPTPFAALKQVQITHRDNTSVAIDLSNAMKVGAERVPLPLQPGDIVRVPKNTNQVLVMNAVQRPGYQPIPETGTLTVGNAILQAGGPAGRAKLFNVAIVRPGQDGKMNTQIVAVNQLSTNKTTGQLPMNTVLQPGDIVYVPEGRVSTPILQTALGTLSSLTVVRSLFGY